MVLEQEMRGIHCGMKLAISLGVPKLLVTTDSQLAVDMLLGEHPPPWTFRNMVKEKQYPIEF